MPTSILTDCRRQSLVKHRDRMKATWWSWAVNRTTYFSSLAGYLIIVTQTSSSSRPDLRRKLKSWAGSEAPLGRWPKKRRSTRLPNGSVSYATFLSPGVRHKRGWLWLLYVIIVYLCVKRPLAPPRGVVRQHPRTGDPGAHFDHAPAWLCGPPINYGKVVNRLALRRLKKKGLSHQRVHLHCFSGNARMVQAWLEAFPYHAYCYFGISGLVHSFDEDQLQAVGEIPLNRLIVETDTPSEAALWMQIQHALLPWGCWASSSHGPGNDPTRSHEGYLYNAC